jgi:hypothetical protein
MKRFIQYLNEGYSVVPKTDSEITKLVKMKDIEGKEVLLFIYDNFRTIYRATWKDSLPIAAQVKEFNTVKMSRSYDIKKLKSPLEKAFPQFDVKMNKKSLTVKQGRKIIFKIEEGEGSRNAKAGGGIKGKKFEDDLARDLLNYKADPRLIKYNSITDQLVKVLKDSYKIDLDKDDYNVEVEGGKNQKRKPSWSKSGGLKFTPSGNIGKIVTDVTVTSGNKTAFLSLKFGSQFYMINASIRPYLHTDKITEDVKERNDIVKYFGFNPKEFLNAYGITSEEDSIQGDSKTHKVWEEILKGVIGNGYIYVVGGGSHDVVIDSHKDPDVKVNSITARLYAIQGKRKYSKISLSVTIDGRGYNLDCQFRGTTATDVFPYYLRVLVK